MKPLIFVVGPTAVGKSDFALQAATRFKGVILNCDSVQTYAHVQIGAAKPDMATRAKVPHHMLDFVLPPHQLTAAEFRREALDQLEVLTANHTVFAVGGSGFYLRALQKGLYPMTKVPKERTVYWQARLDQEGSIKLHQELEKVDAAYAKKLSPNDGYRILRALETIENEGRSITDIQAEFAKNHTPLPYRTLKIGFELPREELRKRIELRTQTMISAGLRQEVEGLIRKGLQSWAPLKSVGYKEMVDGILSGASDQEIAQQITLSTAQLAKKQMTWFRGDKEINWFASGNWQKPLDFVSDFLAED